MDPIQVKRESMDSPRLISGKGIADSSGDERTRPTETIGAESSRDHNDNKLRIRTSETSKAPDYVDVDGQDFKQFKLPVIGRNGQLAPGVDSGDRLAPVGTLSQLTAIGVGLSPSSVRDGYTCNGSVGSASPLNCSSPEGRGSSPQHTTGKSAKYEDKHDAHRNLVGTPEQVGNDVGRKDSVVLSKPVAPPTSGRDPVLPGIVCTKQCVVQSSVTPLDILSSVACAEQLRLTSSETKTEPKSSSAETSTSAGQSHPPDGQETRPTLSDAHVSDLRRAAPSLPWSRPAMHSQRPVDCQPVQQPTNVSAPMATSATEGHILAGVIQSPRAACRPPPPSTRTTVPTRPPQFVGVRAPGGVGPPNQAVVPFCEAGVVFGDQQACTFVTLPTAMTLPIRTEHSDLQIPLRRPAISRPASFPVVRKSHPPKKRKKRELGQRTKTTEEVSQVVALPASARPDQVHSRHPAAHRTQPGAAVTTPSFVHDLRRPLAPNPAMMVSLSACQPPSNIRPPASVDGRQVYHCFTVNSRSPAPVLGESEHGTKHISYGTTCIRPQHPSSTSAPPTSLIQDQRPKDMAASVPVPHISVDQTEPSGSQKSDSDRTRNQSPALSASTSTALGAAVPSVQPSMECMKISNQTKTCTQHPAANYTKRAAQERSSHLAATDSVGRHKAKPSPSVDEPAKGSPGDPKRSTDEAYSSTSEAGACTTTKVPTSKSVPSLLMAHLCSPVSGRSPSSIVYSRNTPALTSVAVRSVPALEGGQERVQQAPQQQLLQQQPPPPQQQQHTTVQQATQQQQQPLQEQPQQQVLQQQTPPYQPPKQQHQPLKQQPLQMQPPAPTPPHQPPLQQQPVPPPPPQQEPKIKQLPSLQPTHQPQQLQPQQQPKQQSPDQLQLPTVLLQAENEQPNVDLPHGRRRKRRLKSPKPVPKEKSVGGTSSKKRRPNDAVIVCNLCQHTVNYNLEWKRHIKEKHWDLVKVFSCKECFVIFEDKAQFLQHLTAEHPKMLPFRLLPEKHFASMIQELKQFRPKSQCDRHQASTSNQQDNQQRLIPAPTRDHMAAAPFDVTGSSGCLTAGQPISCSALPLTTNANLASPNSVDVSSSERTGTRCSPSPDQSREPKLPLIVNSFSFQPGQDIPQFVSNLSTVQSRKENASLISQAGAGQSRCQTSCSSESPIVQPEHKAAPVVSDMITDHSRYQTPPLASNSPEIQASLQTPPLSSNNPEIQSRLQKSPTSSYSPVIQSRQATLPLFSNSPIVQSVHQTSPSDSSVSQSGHRTPPLTSNSLVQPRQQTPPLSSDSLEIEPSHQNVLALDPPIVQSVQQMAPLVSKSPVVEFEKQTPASGPNSSAVSDSFCNQSRQFTVQSSQEASPLAPNECALDPVSPVEPVADGCTPSHVANQTPEDTGSAGYVASPIRDDVSAYSWITDNDNASTKSYAESPDHYISDSDIVPDPAQNSEKQWHCYRTDIEDDHPVVVEPVGTKTGAQPKRRKKPRTRKKANLNFIEIGNSRTKLNIRPGLLDAGLYKKRFGRRKRRRTASCLTLEINRRRRMKEIRRRRKASQANDDLEDGTLPDLDLPISVKEANDDTNDDTPPRLLSGYLRTSSTAEECASFGRDYVVCESAAEDLNFNPPPPPLSVHHVTSERARSKSVVGEEKRTSSGAQDSSTEPPDSTYDGNNASAALTNDEDGRTGGTEEEDDDTHLSVTASISDPDTDMLPSRLSKCYVRLQRNEILETLRTGTLKVLPDGRFSRDQSSKNDRRRESCEALKSSFHPHFGHLQSNRVNHQRPRSLDSATINTSTGDESTEFVESSSRSDRREAEPSWGCMLCTYTSTVYESLRRHVQARHISCKQYVCSKCRLVSGRCQTVEEHILSAHGEVPVDVLMSTSGPPRKELTDALCLRLPSETRWKNVRPKLENVARLSTFISVSSKVNLGDASHYKCCICDKQIRSAVLIRRHVASHWKSTLNNSNGGAQWQDEVAIDDDLLLDLFDKNCRITPTRRSAAYKQTDLRVKSPLIGLEAVASDNCNGKHKKAVSKERTRSTLTDVVGSEDGSAKDSSDCAQNATKLSTMRKKVEAPSERSIWVALENISRPGFCTSLSDDEGVSFNDSMYLTEKPKKLSLHMMRRPTAVQSDSMDSRRSEESVTSSERLSSELSTTCSIVTFSQMDAGQ